MSTRSSFSRVRNALFASFMFTGLLLMMLPNLLGDENRLVRSLVYQVTTTALAQASTTFTVNSTVDGVDGNPGNGVCATAAGLCTLRAAVQESNATASGSVQINLPAGLYNLTITGFNENASATGDLDFTRSVTITGAGAGQSIIDGNDLDRVLDSLTVGIVVNISGVRIQNGRDLGVGDAPGEGGGIRILQGQVTFNNSSIFSNQSSDRGGGIFIDTATGSLTLNNTTVSNNTADQAGGIFIRANATNITGSTINNNIATTTGFGAGGGIFITFGAGNDEVNVTNSTISSNGFAAGSEGGGIYIEGGTLTLKSVTLKDNSADSPNGSDNGGGIYNESGQPAIISQNTIFDNPTGGNCAGAGVTSSGHNLERGFQCLENPVVGDQTTDNPLLLGPLANNGGPTQTHLPLSGSPAIDKGNSAGLTTDQRGFTRPVDNPAIPNAPGGNGSDVGAVEVQAATAAGSEIVGTITTPDNQPLAGVVVQLDGTGSALTITDSLGRYSFYDLEPLGFYTVTPFRVDFNFLPQSRTVNLVPNRVEALFTASRLANPTSNPLDTEMFFVRQHYLDFLGREPDSSGLAYWTREITNCGSDLSCVRKRRIDVSAAFFDSDEFKRTGYFIYRIYKAGLGRRLSYSEFSADHAHVRDGANLEESRKAFSAAFVRREEFVRKYETHLTAASFVDALLTTVRSSGVDLSAMRDSLIASYQSGSDLNQSRALVLSELIENAAFHQAEYNPSFVLMEYFAYLRRDPDSSGYDFWLEILNNRHAGNYRGMVCAFIMSAEYQQRFSSVVTHNDRECGQ